MELDLIKNIVDFGLVVLIWLVQLCIYPAFTYFKKDELLKWHKSYTPKITSVVLPLMATQLGLSIYFVYNEATTIALINLILVMLTWVSTFLIYVPLHNKIKANQTPLKSSKKLVDYNWLRVFLWNLIFLINLFF